MTVLSLTPVLNAPSLPALQQFYAALFGLSLAEDMGWHRRLQAGPQTSRAAQVMLATTGGEGTPVPELRIAVDDVDAYAEKARALGHDILYGPETESWGARRFMLLDPAGNLLEVVAGAP